MGLAILVGLAILEGLAILAILAILEGLAILVADKMDGAYNKRYSVALFGRKVFLSTSWMLLCGFFWL